MVGIEAQEVSHRLNRHTLRRAGLEDVVELRHSDFRNPAALPEAEYHTYDLVTGSPPYFPLGKGVASPHHQRAACRMELPVATCSTIAGWPLAPCRARACCASATPGETLAPAALTEMGLTIRDRRDIFFRRNREPTIVVWAAGFGGDGVVPQSLFGKRTGR